MGEFRLLRPGPFNPGRDDFRRLGIGGIIPSSFSQCAMAV